MHTKQLARHSGMRSAVVRRGPLVVRAVSSLPVITSAGRSVLLNPNQTFVDGKGDKIKPMPVDYGFRSGGGRLYEDRDGDVPESVLELASENFKVELKQMRQSFRFNSYYEEYIKLNPPSNAIDKFFVHSGAALAAAIGKLDMSLEEAGVLPKLEPSPPVSDTEVAEFDAIRAKLGQLRLDNAAVIRYEEQRVAKAGGDFETPLVVRLPFVALCWVLDIVYDNRPIQKFWVLETVARIPYMAYISILHLYETIGFWRAGAELRKVHFAEEWNEMHHLQIMESLGGDQAWFDRFIAQHSAVAYYWLLIVFYLASPKIAYNFMRRVEHHASDTYCAFLNSNKEILESIPPPRVALAYYRNADLYLFDEFQTDKKGSVPPRRPECNNLADVFSNIRDDEDQHVLTLLACETTGIKPKIGESLNSDGSMRTGNN